MGFQDLIRDMIAVADSVTKSLQAPVQHWAWISSGSGANKVVYDASVERMALVEHKQSLRRTTTGEVVLARTKVTFLEPVEPNGAVGRREPIDPRDKIILPDGSTAPIVDVAGLVDPGTNLPYLYEVYLG